VKDPKFILGHLSEYHRDLIGSPVDIHRLLLVLGSVHRPVHDTEVRHPVVSGIAVLVVNVHVGMFLDLAIPKSLTTNLVTRSTVLLVLVSTVVLLVFFFVIARHYLPFLAIFIRPFF